MLVSFFHFDRANTSDLNASANCHAANSSLRGLYPQIQCTVRGSCKTSYWAEIPDSTANCAYKDHDGFRKNLNVTIKRDDGNQVPRTRRTRRTDAWARVLFSCAQTSLDLPRHIVDFFGQCRVSAPRT